MNVVKNKNTKQFHAHQYQKVATPLKNKKKRIIVIAGPTAVGKTKMSLSLAEILGGEIVSADSMQVYRGMDIGTAKVSKEDREKVPHHLIDIHDVDKPFNVMEFYQRAHSACRDILKRGKVPIVVGGSGFYISVFLYGPPLGPPSQDEIRAKLEKQLDEMGAECLYERLQMLDPDYAKTITEHDRHKIVRALEIITITEKRVSDLPMPEKILDDLYDFRLWFLYYPREILYPLIEMRCEEMIEGGLIEEVQELMKHRLCQNASASTAIGYKQCLDFLKTDQSETEKELFIENFKKATRHYMKKQFTWFRKEPYFRWINLDEIDYERAKEYILQDYEQGY